MAWNGGWCLWLWSAHGPLAAGSHEVQRRLAQSTGGAEIAVNLAFDTENVIGIATAHCTLSSTGLLECAGTRAETVSACFSLFAKQS